jgi:hypothetical protein
MAQPEQVANFVGQRRLEVVSAGSSIRGKLKQLACVGIRKRIDDYVCFRYVA